MKLKLLQQVWRMTKLSLYGFLLQVLLYQFLWAENVSAQRVTSVREVHINVNLKNANLEEVFAYIESKTDFSFSYNIEDLSRQVLINRIERRLSVATLLEDISKQANLKFKQVNKNISVDRIREVNKQEKILEVIIQTRTITGKVTAMEDNEGLPGVNVVEKGTSNGTVTNVNGEYSLEVSEGATLVFSSVGYTTEEVEIGNRSVIDLTMTQDIQQLQELVVIGYGERERRDVTGAISQIDSKEIQKSIPAMSPEMAMQGRMAGVFVSNPGSDPAARPDIRIRGVGTLGFNDPLYVVDGIPITEGGAANVDGVSRVNDLRGPINIFAMINPNDIESISVLKDASATAIYGVRAANGVIIITTKRGSEGKPKVNVSASYGIQNIFKRYDVTSVQDYVMLTREAWNNNTDFNPDVYFPLFDETSDEYLGNNPQYTNDWVEAGIQDNAAVQEYNVSVQGGTSKSNFALGGGFATQDNVMFRGKFDRYSLFINSDHQLTDWLKIGESYRIAYTVDDRDGPVNGLDNAFVAPWQPLYDNENVNGRNGLALPGRIINGNFNSRGYGNGTRDNFLGRANHFIQRRELLRNMGSVYAEITPLKGLRIRGTYSVDYYTNIREQYTELERELYSATGGIINPEDGNTYGRRLNENKNFVGELLIGYNFKLWQNHNFDIILNAMDQKVTWNNQQAGLNTLSNIPSWEQRRIDQNAPPEAIGYFYERTPSGLQGYMGRLSYNYSKKYYLDVTVRRDGSSKFAPGYKWGTFPSIGAAWRISDESFMESLSFLSDLKIRAGWGQTGNQETRDFAYLSLVDFRYATQFGTRSTERIGDGNYQQGAVLGDFPIEDLSWETVTTANFGFDSEWWNGKLSITAEYYQRITDGILQTINIPLVIGVTNRPVQNLAKVENRGFEMQGNYRDKIGEVGYNLGFNLTTVRNRVQQVYQGRPQGGNDNRIEEGLPINSFFGYRTAGIFQTEAEVTEWLNQNDDPGNEAQKSPGDVIFSDLYGPPAEGSAPGIYRSDSPDGRITADDRDYLGKSIPGYFYGLNLGFDYKNFDLYLNFRGLGDVQKINRNGRESISGGGGNYLAEYLGRWTPENPSNTIPRALNGNPTGNNRFSDRFIEDAGFLRFQNFQLGYNFTGDALKRMGIGSLRAYVSGANLFVLTPYNDLDPEDITTPTTFTFGVNLGF